MKVGEGSEGVEVIQNCGHDCGNPVISPAKAGHSGDPETQMLSRLCLASLFTPSPSLANLVECQGVVLPLSDSQIRSPPTGPISDSVRTKAEVLVQYMNSPTV